MTRRIISSIAVVTALACTSSWAADNNQGYSSANPTNSNGSAKSDSSANASNTPNSSPVVLSTVPFGGMDAAPHSVFGYFGVIHALNGNMAKPGIMLQGVLGYGQFNYNTTNVPSGKVDGTYSMADLLVGYQTYINNYTINGYAGLDYQKIGLSPNDPFASVRGSKAGLKISGQFQTNEYVPLYVDAMGSYATAFNSFWLRLRGGYNFHPSVVGPEFVAQGNKGGNSYRFGAFFSTFHNLSQGDRLSAYVSGGYSFSKSGGDSNLYSGTKNGPYGALTVAYVF